MASPAFTVILTGGEPFLYPGLEPLLDGIKDLGCRRLVVASNGLKLARQPEAW